MIIQMPILTFIPSLVRLITCKSKGYSLQSAEPFEIGLPLQGLREVSVVLIQFKLVVGPLSIQRPSVFAMAICSFSEKNR